MDTVMRRNGGADLRSQRIQIVQLQGSEMARGDKLRHRFGIARTGLDRFAHIEDVHLGALAGPQAKRKLIAQGGARTGPQKSDVSRSLRAEGAGEEEVV